MRPISGINSRNPSGVTSGVDTIGIFNTISGTNVGEFLGWTSGVDTILALGGDDRLDGRQAADRLDGGSGIDTAVYEVSPAGVKVFLGALGVGFGPAPTSSSSEDHGRAATRRPFKLTRLRLECPSLTQSAAAVQLRGACSSLAGLSP